ncbi:Presequence protease-like protein [Leptotrombidium deliense]|uniref:Presequence protease, mitochondrial n=1 Tax=Leptotrombidium deliense TaxID=299467 RepID=A0A443SF76_9ACAR|nr:Presequence protease-like protein [Leptotrombidium deliense]
MFKLSESVRTLPKSRLLHACRRKKALECMSKRWSTTILPKETSNNIHKIGDLIHGYRLLRLQDVPELCLTAYHLQHEQTGAQHLHIARDDMNNAFAVSLRTTPTDDTGVAHILEHISLCGSTKYPIRDPFFKMLTRSLSTYMNAHTGPDYTMYPFSTQNQKDYENLMRVYLDAVFWPNLSETDFRQEGWRLENEDVNNKSSPISLKGVVYNEMKGVYSSSQQLYYREILRHIFPLNTYANDSGGDPISIPSLTYEQLKNFHRKHYHPSNAKFYTYGNFPLDFNLSLINDLVLSKFERNDNYKVESEVKIHPSWNQSKHKKIECALDPLAPFPERQTTASVSFLLEDITKPYDAFVLVILSYLLAHGQNSAFFEPLLASGLGMDFSPGTGLSEFTKQSFFSVGLTGIAENQVDLVYDVVMKTLEDVAKNGFNEQLIEACLHLIEISIKHQVLNFGVNVMINLNPVWNHDGDPIASLQINKHMQQFREDLKNDSRFLQKKVEQYFLKNNHRLYLSMSPSADFVEKRTEEENKLLKSKVDVLNDAGRTKIYENGLELAKKQNEIQDLSLLPTLNVYTDISRDYGTTNVDKMSVNGVPVQVAPQPTNKVSYFRALFTVDDNEIPQHLKPYLQLFCDVVTKLGAGNKDYKEMDRDIQLRTGGLLAKVHVEEHHSLSGDYEQGILFSSFALERNLESMLNIWADIFNGVKFDENKDHLMQLIKISSSELAQSVPHEGHRYAMTRAASSLTDAANLRELCGGLSYVQLLKNISESANCDDVIDKLKEVSKYVFRKNTMRCALNAEPSTIRTSLNLYDKFLSNLSLDSKSQKLLSLDPKPPITTLKEHHVLPFSCNYIGKAHYCAPFTHEAFSKLLVASKLMTAKYLHREIREKGGAYGGGAGLNDGGIFSFYSYRDPNVQKTLDAFEGALKWILDSNNYSKQDLNEAKLSVFQVVDKPVIPGDQGMRQFIRGINDQMFHEHRLRVLDVTKEDITAAVNDFLFADFKKFSVSLLGPDNPVTKAEKWKIIHNEMLT